MLHHLQQPSRTHPLVGGQQGGERDGRRNRGGESISISDHAHVCSFKSLPFSGDNRIRFQLQRWPAKFVVRNGIKQHQQQQPRIKVSLIPNSGSTLSVQLLRSGGRKYHTTDKKSEKSRENVAKRLVLHSAAREKNTLKMNH